MSDAPFPPPPGPPVPPPLPPQAPAPPPWIYAGGEAQQQRMEDNLGMRLLLPVGRSGWAIAAGYLGLFGLAIVPAPLALIVSLIAIRSIKKSRAAGTPKYGMGRAVFGLIVGITGTALMLAFFGYAAMHRK